MVESTAMMAAFAVVVSAVAPGVAAYVAEAKALRAATDVRVLALGMTRLLNDVQSVRAAGGWRQYDLLVSEGAAPGADRGAEAWTGQGLRVSSLDDHLLTNDAEYPSAQATGSLRLGWRGPYVNGAVAADPWGHRYAVNVRSLLQGDGDTLVLSAGADSVVDTPFHPRGASAADVWVVIQAAGR